MNYRHDIDYSHYEDNSLLFLAADKGYIDIVSLLIDKGADVNFLADEGYTTPLRAATHEGLRR